MKIGFSSNAKSVTGSPFYQYLCTITGTLSIFASAMHYGWASPSLPKLLESAGAGNHSTSTFTLSDSQGSWVAVMMLFGGPIGSMVGGASVDTFGRKKMMLLSTIPFFTAWLLIAYSTSAALLYVARFIAGLADGLVFTVVPMYLGEIAGPEVRGLIGSSCSVVMMFGVLAVNILGLYMDIKTSALISAVVPVFFLATFAWMPESPYFLIMKGDGERAKENLRTLRGVDDVDCEIARLTKAVEDQSKSSGRFLDLFLVKSNRRGLIIIGGLRAVQQLSGITAITFYAQTIFKEAGEDISAEVVTIVYFSIQCIFTVVSAAIIDKTGRKPLSVVSTVGCAICLLTQACYYYAGTVIDVSKYSFVPVAALILFVVVYCIGLGTIPVLMLGELFPTDVKAFALCIAEIYYCALATIASKFFQIMKDDFGICIPFFVFATCCLLGLVFVTMVMPETKGKTLEEIQECLKGEDGDRGVEEVVCDRKT